MFYFMYIFPRTSIIVTALLLSRNIMGESDLEDSATHPFEHITAASNIVIQVCQYNFGTHFHDKPLMNHPFPQLHYFNLMLSLLSSRLFFFANNKKKKKNHQYYQGTDNLNQGSKSHKKMPIFSRFFARDMIKISST